MKSVILFGATGNLGGEIAKELVRQGYDLTAVARNETRAQKLKQVTSNIVIADVSDRTALTKILDGQDIVVSAMGKSVSPNDRSKATFKEVDLKGNLNILNEAIRAGIKKFVYISAFHSEKYLHLEYFRVHHEFSEALKRSGIDYSIIKPPAIFSAFIDVVEMSKKGRLVHLGKGDKKTNPIFEGDLAKIAVDSIKHPNSTVEAGGKMIYTRRQINEIIQNQVNPGKKLRTVPLAVLKLTLPLVKIFDKNLFDKFAFFVEVMQHDTIAPQVGTMRFEDYLKLKTQPIETPQ